MENNNHKILPAGTVLRGRVYTYKIEKVLGQGTFGITYRASTQIKGPLGEVTVQVAVKEFFAKELDNRLANGAVSSRSKEGIAYKYARAFQRESENLSKMQHPGIVNVLEAFEDKGTYYYSMEYLSGGSLDDKVRGIGIPEEEALPLITKIGDALSYMHDRKVMHLDLKPKNIMLKGDGSPVIIDFGLSKQYDDSGEIESSSTIGLGTPGYAPVEQANQTSGKVFQPTLDIYALGATLYKMLTGVTPPVASTILEEGLPEDQLKARSVSAKTISAIREAMQPSRLNRPQSVSAFLKQLPVTPGSSPMGGKNCVDDDTVVDETDVIQIEIPQSQEGAVPDDMNHLPPLTIACLGLLLIACFSVLVSLLTEYISSFNLYKNGDINYIIAVSGAFAAAGGLIMLLLKRKTGFWLFIAGAVVSSFFWWKAEVVGAPEQSPLVFLIPVISSLFLYFVLRIKNAKGFSAWQLFSMREK